MSVSLTCAQLINLARFVQKNNPKVVFVNPQKSKRWVNSHPPHLRDGAEKMLAAIEFVTLRKFSHAVDTTLKNFINKEKDLESIVIVVPSYRDIDAMRSGETETIKSGHWLVGRALRKFPILQDLELVSTHESERMRSIFTKRGKIRALLSDDMGVTGGQLQDNVAEVLRNTPKRLHRTSEFNLLVPYVTPFAERRVSFIIPMWYQGATINWLGNRNDVRSFNEYMFGSADVQGEADPEYRDALLTSEIIFEHDEEGGGYDFRAQTPRLQILSKVASRRSNGRGGEKKRIPFIEWGPPTYQGWMD